ncbi:UDP-glucose dehydrogenase family protein [Sediminibacillus massiliensis]|uniref:UDP-glucose dehydrogenase family protein n=1 Tax=Sediminibacillus massiliensis TaxID=1926277 RepID=UPI0009885C1B|nr:UDP-glucose/GDP-mannose dehydrogenase family protein [Sediminibacillus massiliensis]
MKIAVIGSGYVGLVTGACLAEIGHQVTCLDVDQEKVALLKKGKSPIYEKGLEELMETNRKAGRLDFSADYAEGLLGKKVIYVAVGTPEQPDGSADLSFIEAVCNRIAETVTEDTIIVTKSTVPVGTNEYMKTLMESRLQSPVSISVVSNPEFLRQGTAIHDTFHGDRIVIGSNESHALDILEKINEPFDIPIVRTDLRSAEMIKYASNAFLAAKISFINEISQLCSKVGADIDNVSIGIGMDSRIGGKFLKAGVGYGGSCFPKDTNALISVGKTHGCSMHMLESVQLVNRMQRLHIVQMIKDRFGDLYNRKAAVLGLTFKANTDDMRDAPSIQIIDELIAEGAQVVAFDPIATENARNYLAKEVSFTDTLETALTDADFALILTDWQQIKDYPLAEYQRLLEQPVIFDGRNCLRLEDISRSGIEYHSVGRQVMNAFHTERDKSIHTF